MKLFLTSNIGGSYKEDGKRIPGTLDRANHLLELFEKYWRKNSKCLILSSDPDNAEMNDDLTAVYAEAFKTSHLPLSKIDVCDRRNENKLAGRLDDYDVLLLSGGHVPTQNRFFNRIHLKESIKNYEGMVIGISAGTMNCAEVVYAQPELEGEAVDPEYQRYLDGLDLTKITILPHFQFLKNQSLDGLRILEDISLLDSKIRPFYALVDGAYILVDNDKSTLYGEAYWIHDGAMTKICETDKNIAVG